MFRSAALFLPILLAACNPPAAEDYVARVGAAGRDAPSPPIASPDTAGAVWAPSPANPQRLLYGKPGERVLFALECAEEAGTPVLIYARQQAADPHAKAVLALIGNGHVARLKIDAVQENPGADARWLWRGRAPAARAEFEGLTGARAVEATVPGAGSLVLNPNPLVGELIARCRAQARPAAPASAPAATAPEPQNPADTTDRAAPPPPPAR